MRLTHPCGGTATLGGVPLECVSREAIGELIGYVGQNPFVFAGTIAENIAYGSEGATDGADPPRRASMACIHDEIMAMPGGYHARVAERGQNLSGGQRQRIALARVFLKNPPILILDEGTSALDNISERQVQQAINAARADRTVILVAHRLSTLLRRRPHPRLRRRPDRRDRHLRRARPPRRRLRRAGPLGRERLPDPHRRRPRPRDRRTAPRSPRRTRLAGDDPPRRRHSPRRHHPPRREDDHLTRPIVDAKRKLISGGGGPCFVLGLIIHEEILYQRLNDGTNPASWVIPRVAFLDRAAGRIQPPTPPSWPRSTWAGLRQVGGTARRRRIRRPGRRPPLPLRFL